MIKKIVFLGALLLAGSALFACNMTFYLAKPGQEGVRITPDSEMTLEKDDEYVLTVMFKEDHGRCLVKPEETVFLLDDEKWKLRNDEAAFKLKEEIKWSSLSSIVHVTEIPFIAKGTGEVWLEVVRECRKGGYDEYFEFNIAG